MRKAPVIGMKELENHIESMMKRYPEFPYEMPGQLRRDLEKVDFDWENWDVKDTLVLDNELPIRFMWAGGDWESPVAFALYWDGKQMRAYIPKDGNPYNRKEKRAHHDGEDGYEQDFDWKKMAEDIYRRIEITSYD